MYAWEYAKLHGWTYVNDGNMHTMYKISSGTQAPATFYVCYGRCTPTGNASVAVKTKVPPTIYDAFLDEDLQV